LLRRNNNKVLIHFHIGRTGGVSFRHQILQRKFGPTLMPITVNKIHASVNTKDGFTYIKDYCNLPNIEKNKINCLSGHIPFGIHKYIPRSSTYISLIRNPVDRIISEWNSVCTKKNHPFNKHVLSKYNLNFEDYISLDFINDRLDVPDDIFMGAAVPNHQTRFYNGILYKDALPKLYCDLPDTLTSAKINIEKYFPIIGVAEKYDQFLVLLKKMYGWNYKDICYPDVRLNTTKEHNSNISNKYISLIEKYNSDDMGLYEFICKRFDNQVRKYDNFNNDLNIFRKKNITYGNLYLKYIYNVPYKIYKKSRNFLSSRQFD